MAGMAVSDDALLDAIETSLFLFPEVPGLLETLEIPGIQGRLTSVFHPLANLVGASTLSPDDADAVILQVHELFAAQNKPFGWLVGPSSTPSDLTTRLQGAELFKADELAGMAMTDLSTPIQSNPAVQIHEAMLDETVEASGLMARSYGLPEDVARFFCEVYVRLSDQIRTRVYLAYLEGADEAVGFSSLVYISDQPIVLLGGAATLEQHRGKGIYTSFVAKRLADARADGAEAAVIQAVRSTSAPICAKLGFRELAALEFYVWMPGQQPA
jgi:hypothetical protein